MNQGQKFTKQITNYYLSNEEEEEEERKFTNTNHSHPIIKIFIESFIIESLLKKKKKSRIPMEATCISLTKNKKRIESTFL